MGCWETPANHWSAIYTPLIPDYKNDSIKLYDGPWNKNNNWKTFPHMPTYDIPGCATYQIFIFNLSMTHIQVILRGRQILHKNRSSDKTDRLQCELAEPSVAGAKTVLYCPSEAMIGRDRAREGGRQTEGGRNVHTHFILIIVCEDLNELLHPHVCLLLEKYNPGWIFSKGLW